jgi:hypothetical protein
MNLTPLQERRLRQVEDEIIFLQKEVEKKGIWFALRFSWMTVMIFYIVGYFFDYLFDRTLLTDYVNEFGWIKILTSWIFWFLIDYHFIVRENNRRLRAKIKELAELKIKYGLTKKAVS